MNCQLHAIHRKGFEKEVQCLAYHKWEIGDSEEPASSQVEASFPAESRRHVLLLPELCGTGFFTEEGSRGVHAVIEEDWLVLGRDGKFALSAVAPWDKS